jgi:F-type H+-transporting ATPase subunit b
MRLDWGTIALQTANLAVLLFLLHRFLYRPALRMIDARKAEVQDQYEKAKAADKKAKAHLAEVEAEKAGLAALRETALKDAAVQAQEAAKVRSAKAEREAQELLDGARKTIALERQRVLEEARTIALDLSIEFARHLVAELPAPVNVGEWIDPFRSGTWIERIEEYLNALPERELDSLVRQLAEGRALTVVTASPLAPAAAEAWGKRLRQSLGDTVTILFSVDRKLIAGAELHFPSAVLRFSWQSAMTSLQAEAAAGGRTCARAAGGGCE